MQSQKLLIVVALLLALTALTACGGAPAADTAPTEAPAEAPAEAAAPTEAPAAEAAAEEAAAAEAPAAAAASAAAEIRTFAIDQAESEARFQLDEELMGAPKTVVGVTSQIEGAIEVDLADMTRTTVSPIQIDASDIKTDSGMRDRAIRRFILQSGDEQYRYITFTPTAIEGLPAQAAPGDELSFTIAGDLKIRDITRPVTFDVTVTVDADNQLSGLAKTTVLRSDFDLQIPSVPSVANVTEEVGVELAFVAVSP